MGFVGALGRTLNVQGVRLACGRRAPPRPWTLLIALAGRSWRDPSAGWIAREVAAGARHRDLRRALRRPHAARAELVLPAHPHARPHLGGDGALLEHAERLRRPHL